MGRGFAVLQQLAQRPLAGINLESLKDVVAHHVFLPCRFVIAGQASRCSIYGVPIILYSWRRKDPQSGRWRVLNWKMTDEDAKRWAERVGAEIEQVPNSGEGRTPVSGYGAVFFPARSTEAIDQHFDDLGAKREDDE